MSEPGYQRPSNPNSAYFSVLQVDPEKLMAFTAQEGGTVSILL